MKQAMLLPTARGWFQAIHLVGSIYFFASTSQGTKSGKHKHELIVKN